MMAITHAAIAAAGTSLIFATSDPLPLVLAVVGSQLPDVDTTSSVIGQICFPVANWLESRYPHRTVTHSLVATAGLAVICVAIGFVLGAPLRLLALPVGHLLACFADAFTRQGVQLFWPEPVWCISVSNPRRRLVTGGPAEYWVLAVAVALLVLGCWMAGNGGVTGQVNQSLGLRSGAVATYNRQASAANVYAELTGVWADDRSRADGRYLILGVDDDEFILTDGTGVYHTGESLVVERLTVEATEASTRQIQTLTFNDEPPTAQLQQLMLTYSGRQIYLSGTLTVDYPEEIMLPAPGKSLETASLTGETLKLNYHPLNLALVQLANQWVSGHITVQIQ